MAENFWYMCTTRSVYHAVSKTEWPPGIALCGYYRPYSQYGFTWDGKGEPRRPVCKRCAKKVEQE